MTAFVSEIIRYESVEDFGYELKPETEKLMTHVFREAKKMGFSTRRAAGGLVGTLEYGRGEESVAVLIHLDVVPVSGDEKWDHEPFSGEVADGYIWGWGDQDDKGALAAVGSILQRNKCLSPVLLEPGVLLDAPARRLAVHTSLAPADQGRLVGSACLQGLGKGVQRALNVRGVSHLASE